MYQVYIILLW